MILIGPWTIKVNNSKVNLNVLMCIDTAFKSNVVELIRITNNTLCYIRNKCVLCWLSCYPCLVHCIHNKGEFTCFDTKDVQSTSKHPSLMKFNCIHQTVDNVLGTLLYSNLLWNLTQATDFVDQALATAMHAMQVTVDTTLWSMLGALAFRQDIFLNVSWIVAPTNNCTVLQTVCKYQSLTC